MPRSSGSPTGSARNLGSVRTKREANARGHECLLVEDATESYFPEFKAATLDIVGDQAKKNGSYKRTPVAAAAATPRRGRSMHRDLDRGAPLPRRAAGRRA